MKAARIPTKASAATPPIYQLHIELRDLKPAIWRRVLVPQSVTLAKLHQVIQIAMGWTNSHLHEFTIGRIRYGMPSRESIEPDLLFNEKRATLQASLPPSTKSFSYSYDFGDGWEHTLRVEKTLAIDPAFHYPVCMAGAAGYGLSSSSAWSAVPVSQPSHSASLRMTGIRSRNFLASSFGRTSSSRAQPRSRRRVNATRPGRKIAKRI
jgi:Plasmid pRiA4b ORF-3-like protein